MRYVMIEKRTSLVVNVLDDPALPDWPTDFGYLAIASNTALMGQYWDGETFSDPVPDLNPYGFLLSKYAFRERFTDEEKVAIELASIDNPSLPLNDPVRAQQAALRVYIRDIDSAKFINLQLPKLRSAVEMLELAGLLAPGRASVILDAPVEQGELP